MRCNASSLGVAFGLAVALGLAGCESGGGGWTTDQGIPEDSKVDGLSDASVPPDQTVDSPMIQDQGLPDLAPDGATDAAGDAAGDGSPSDAVADAPSTAPLWGYVSRSVAPALDGKGPVYVALGFPPHLGHVQADLSTEGSKVLYQVWGVPAGTYAVTAFLDDNDNAFPVMPFADPGDLVLANPPQVTITAGSQRKDLVLDKVEGTSSADGGIGDAAASLGAVKGTITAKAVPTGDAKGNLHISLHAALPPAALVSATMINNADLSSPFASEAFFLGGVPAGKYYLRVFLDDNANVGPFGGEPDNGDLVHGTPIQVHVIGGQTNVQDVVLDTVAK